MGLLTTTEGASFRDVHESRDRHFILEGIEYFDTRDGSFRRADIEVHGDLIVGIHPPGRTSARRMVPGEGLLCLPGLVNAHLHPSKERYRGQYGPGSASEMLDVVHKNNRAESNADQGLASLYALSRSALQGVTSVGIFTSRAEVDAEQAETSGLRASVFFSQNDKWSGGGEVPRTIGLDELIKEFERVSDACDQDRISINPATASEFSATEALLVTLHDLARKRGRRFSMHIQEGPERVDTFVRANGETGIARLSRLRILDEHTTLVHASVMTDKDVELLGGAAVGLIHCPVSNAFTNAGKMRLGDLVQGHDVGIGTDSAMLNPINRIAFEAAFAMHHHQANAEASLRAIEMLTVGGARSININDAGLIEIGKKADFCLFAQANYRSPEPATHALELYLTQSPRTVFVGGRAIVDDYHLTSEWLRSTASEFSYARHQGYFALPSI